MQEAIAPTAERLRHARAYLPPEQSQSVKRPYTRVLDEFQRLALSGRLTSEQGAAAGKLRRHFFGAMGVDVREADDAGGFCDDACEYPRTYHAQKLAQAEARVTPRMWEGLQILLNDMGGIELVGSAACRVRNPVQARAAGFELVASALDLLVREWGLAQRHRPPSR